MSKTMRFAIPTALVLAAALTAGAAQARTDVQWSVTIGAPVYPAYGSVYVQPRPVYVAPAPVYYHQPVPVHRAPRYHGQTRWDRDGDGVPNRYDRVYNPAWDRDGDGIPNRHDRSHNPRWDRDGDGVHNRWDRRDGNPRGDGDRDGVPNRWDRYDHNPGRR